MENIKVYKQLTSLDELEELGLSFGTGEITVSNHLEEAIKNKDISVGDLSELTGISRQTLHGIFTKNRRVGIDVALKLSYVLDIPVNELFYLNQDTWYSLVTDSEDLAIYIDHLNLNLINNQGRKQIEAKSGKEQFVNINTKEMKEKSELSTEELKSSNWHPRFERVVKYIKPIKL